MIRSGCLTVSVGLLALWAGCTDLKSHVPQPQVEQLLTTWLRDEGVPDPNRGFDKGQQAAVAITTIYGYGYAPTESYAELRLTDFRYRDGGEQKVYSGRGKLNLRQSAGGEWFIDRLATISDGDAVGLEFVRARTLPSGG
jgi:hypothetical protein